MNYSDCKNGNKRTLCVVPARAGSKGVPGKNSFPLRGIPLTFWALLAALDSPSICRTILSSDNPELSLEAKKVFGFGIAPFARPEELAQDTSNSVDVALHAVDFLEEVEGEYFDFLLLLEPSTPLRPRGMVEELLQHHVNSHDDRTATVVCGSVHQYPEYMFRIGGTGFLEPIGLEKHSGRRQDAGEYFYPTGQGYVVDIATLRSERTFYPRATASFTIRQNISVEVDSPDDLEVLRLLSESHRFDWVVEDWRRLANEN